VKVLYDEDLASHIAPEPCVRSREGQGEASVGDRAGWPSSRERRIFRVPTVLPDWKATSCRDIASGGSARRGQRPQHVWTLLDREPGDLVADRWCCAPSVRAGKAKGPKPVMNGGEKSDPTIVCAGQRPDREG